jgi:hypothetical protein
MGDSYQQDQQATDLNRRLMARQSKLGEEALGTGLGYSMSELSPSGQIDQSGKFQAMGTDVLQGAASRGISGGTNLVGAVGDIENREAARAIGTSSVAGQRLTSALDQINQVRSTLEGHGLRTTGLASEAGNLGISALSMVPKNPKLSEALGIGATGAALYGGLTQPTAAPNKLSIAPLSGSSFAGSDASLMSSGGAFFDPSTQAQNASAFNLGGT